MIYLNYNKYDNSKFDKIAALQETFAELLLFNKVY